MRVEQKPWISKIERLSCPDTPGPAPGEVKEASRDYLDRVTFQTGTIVEQRSSSSTYKVTHDGQESLVEGRMTVRPSAGDVSFRVGDVEMQVNDRSVFLRTHGKTLFLDATGQGTDGFVAASSPDRLELYREGHLWEVGLPLAWNLFAAQQSD